MTLSALATPNGSHAVRVRMSPRLATSALGDSSFCVIKMFPLDLYVIDYSEFEFEDLEACRIFLEVDQ